MAISLKYSEIQLLSLNFFSKSLEAAFLPPASYDSKDINTMANNAFPDVPRRFRPSLGGMISSTSMSKIPSQTSPKPHKLESIPQGHHRQRRTTEYIDLEPHYAQPTVASSELHARANLRHSLGPAQRFHDARPPLSAYNPQSRIRSRIPTPTRANPNFRETVFRSPALSQDRDGVRTQGSFRQLVSNVNQNVPIQTPQRLMGPLPPGVPPQRRQGGLTKSSTFSVLGTLKSSLSISSLSNLASSRTSLSSTSSSTYLNESAGTPPKISPPPRAGFARFSRRSTSGSWGAAGDVRQVDRFMPDAYWSGRFMTLYDRYLNESLTDIFLDDTKVNDPIKFERLDPHVPELIPSPMERSQIEYSGNGRPNQPKTSSEKDDGEDDTPVCLQSFAQLEAMCLTNDARKSLRAFQQAYARKERREALLPLGGTMIVRDSVLSRASKLFASSKRDSFNASSRPGASWGEKNTVMIGGSRSGYKRQSLASMSEL